jgi:cyanophycinase
MLRIAWPILAWNARVLLIGALLASFGIACLAQSAQGFLEPKGTLVIVGGGDTPPEVDRRFVELAGGPGRARIALLPMALRNNDEEAREVTVDLERLGAKVELVNMSARGARFASTAKRLGTFTGFWFLGGDQSRLSGILVDSPALDAIVRRYQEGAVVGGTSAGAAVMSGVMLTGRYRVEQPPGDVEMFNIGRGMKEVAKGFDFIKGAIIDQHFDTRARYNRLLSAVLDHPQLLGVGIDEQTALIVRPDGLWEVQGRYYVKIFDARSARIVDDEGPMARASDIRMHVLPAGSTFDVERRTVRFPGD